MAKTTSNSTTAAKAPQQTTGKPQQAVTTKGAQAVAVPDELAAELQQDTGKGFEEASRDAFAVPFLRILQDLSPQVKAKMAGYVPGAKPGQIFNTVSQKCADTVRVIPCHYTQTFIEWQPRDKGGGLVAVHPPGTPLVREVVREGSRNILPNGHELQDTRSHFVLLVEADGSYEGALIAMASTALKVSRRWMTQMRAAVIDVGDGRIVQPPMFAWSYRLRTDEEANDQGSWYQWVVEDRERVADVALYRAAKQFGATMASGKVRVNYEEELRSQGTSSGRQQDAPGDLDNEIDA